MTYSETGGNDGPAQLSGEQAQLVARMRWLMRISAFATMPGIGVIFAILGYRVFHLEERPGMIENTAPLPKGARVISTAVAGDRIVVTLEFAGTLEIRTFDAKTLRPQGRLQFNVRAINLSITGGHIHAKIARHAAGFRWRPDAVRPYRRQVYFRDFPVTAL